MSRIVMVAARARNGVIGHEGHIPWSLPADWAHFKRITVGHPLVMGRSTFESIGRPLPDRQSIVVTSDPDWAHEGVLVARTVPEAVRLGSELDPELVNIGGGARLYAEALDLATEQVLSEVDLEPEGDTFYPDFDEADWVEVRREVHPDDDPTWTVRWLSRR